MNYKLIRENIETQDKDNVFLTIFLFFAFIAAYFYFLRDLFSRPIDIVVIVGIIFLLPLTIRRFYSDWTRTKDIIGKIEITPESIICENANTEILTNEIVSLELKQNYIKGKRYLLRDIIHNGIVELKIKMKSGDDHRLVFLIENKEQFEYLGKILKELYKMQICIKETMFNTALKTILLKPHWNFNELQNLRKELNIETI